MLTRRSAWEVFLAVIEQLRHFELWAPLIIYLAIKITFIALYVGTINGLLVSFWELFLDSQYHEAFLHYPAHLMLMPIVLSKLDMILDVLVHSFFQGVTILFFASAKLKEPLSYAAALKGTYRRYLHLVGVTVIASVVIFACLSVVGYVVPKGTSTLIRFGGWGIATFAGLVLQALFLFAGPLVLLKNKSVFAAIRESFEIARINFTHTMILVIAPFLITLPALYLSFKGHALAMSLSPEILPPIQVFSEFLGFFSMLVLVGGATIMLIWRKADEERRS